ncbi:MAG: hypothetical protein K9I68_09390 [Bacteroidales bacterium]|nr:hypothetical protein [Bacteroidales bacterium]MCF8338707.1 hypothetical protein [Bacteroidales bacterium]
MRKRAILLMLLLPVFGFGQLGNSINQPADNLNTDFDMSVGTSFSGLGNGASSFTSYAFPRLRMNPSDNLEVQTGVLMMNTQMSGMPDSYAQLTPGGTANSNFTNAYAFASGTYQFSENFKISGSAYKKLNSQNQMQQQVNPQAFNFDAYGMSMRMEYNISDNATIDAQFNYRKGASPFNNYNRRYSSPFRQSSYMSPF